MGKVDLKKELLACYSAKKEVRFVEIPAITYVTLQGRGDPTTSREFQDAMAVLYGLVYTAKFMCKETGRDFTVMPLEGQWWTDNPAAFSKAGRDEWNWNMMIAVPDFMDKKIFEQAVKKLRDKKNPPGLDRARREVVTDGLSAQFLYFGPYSGEAPYIAEMHRFVTENGYRLRGRHREIYMSNPQRVPQEKLKTIIRHPIEKA